MNKRLISIFLALVLLAALLPAGFASAVENPGKEYGNYITGAQIVRSAASVSVMLTGNKRDAKDPEAWKQEIRVFSFDSATGLFETGEGREPGDEVKWGKWLEDGYGYNVQLMRPGKYLLSGVPVYVLDPANEIHAALLDELDAAVDKADAKTQVTKGTNLYRWFQKRVKAKVPEELAETAKDPVNALITGYCAPEAYAPLLKLVLSLAGIRSVVVDGTRTAKSGDLDSTWLICELDEKWLWADPALDAGKTGTFAKEWIALSQNHTLSEGADTFIQKYIKSNYVDVLLREDMETNERLKLGNRNEGYFHDLVFIDGPLYSVGPSEPVTIHIYRNYDDNIPSDVDDAWIKDNIRHIILQERHIYDDKYHFFRRPLTTDADFSKIEIQPKDVDILEYNKDCTRIVVRFNTPGLYKFWMTGDEFCVLDPDDPEQVEVGRLLDEARDTIKGSTDRETAKKLQDWEASKLKYDRNAYRIIKGLYYDDSLYVSVDFTEENMDTADASQDAFGALASGLSVCGGYANLYTLLLRNAGIPAFQVSGYLTQAQMGHAWNIVRMDGTWLYADPTWDDAGKTSGTKYFCGTFEQYAKHHAGNFSDPDSSLVDLFEHNVYYTMYHRFETRYGVKLDIPEVLRALPGDVSDYGFPASNPVFFKGKFTITDDSIRYDFGKNKINIAYSVHNMRGEQVEAYDLDDKKMFTSDRRAPFARFPKGQIIDLVVTDFLGPYKPTKKSFITQEYVWARTVLEDSTLSYSVPMKRNEIRGYSDKSCRTWSYDMDMHKKSMTWDLEKDSTTLTVTAYFDENGKTVRASVLLTPPSGGSGIGWEMTKDGHVSSLRLDDGNDTYLLAEMTDTWKQNRNEMYLRSVLRKYPSILENEPLPEGVHLYRFSKDDLVTSYDTMFMFRPNLYGGEAIATTDEIFIWDDTGHLQINPDARDLNGTPITLNMGKTVDLSMATRILIAD